MHTWGTTRAVTAAGGGPPPGSRAGGWSSPAFEGAELEASTPVWRPAVPRTNGGALQRLQRAGGGSRRARCLGIDPAVVEQSVAAARRTFGRLERCEIRDRQVWLVLVKNPSGFNQALRLVLGDEDRRGRHAAARAKRQRPRRPGRIVDLGCRLRARRGTPATPDYPLRQRAYDLAFRLKYAGVGDGGNGDGEPSLRRSSKTSCAHSGLPSTGRPPAAPCTCSPTYTAMWALRERLAREGHLPLFWQHDQATVAPV